MAHQEERRRHRRLDIRLPLECSGLDEGAKAAYRTVSTNVSAGGVYFEMDDRPDLRLGSALHIELTVPPGDGHSPYTGRVSSAAEVVRIDPVGRRGGNAHAAGERTENGFSVQPSRIRVATRFREPLKLVF